MRYKALPPSLRRPADPPPPRPVRKPATGRRARDWASLAIMLLLLPALIVPNLVTSAAEPRLLAPAQVTAGSAITVTGTGFEPKARGHLAFDGARTDASFRVSRDGTFALQLTVPAGAAIGPHVIDAMIGPSKPPRGERGGPTARAAATAFVVAASVTIAVVAAGPGGSTVPPTATAGPSAPPSASATPPPGTASPSPPPGDVQPGFPVRAAFYYPWFPEAWRQQGMDPFTRYDPSLGLYDGGAAETVRRHIEAMEYGRIDVGIASWWGQGSSTDTRLPGLLEGTAETTFRWSVYHEGEGQGDPSISQIRDDLAYLADRYGTAPGYFRVGGRFVVFVYADAGDACSMVDRWTSAAEGTAVYLVLKVFSGYRSCSSQPDGWHQYAPAVADDSQAGYSHAISPGFWKANENAPRLARDVARWAQSVRSMVASGAPFQLITTFNEWGEGTSVESATEWASTSGYGIYLDILRDDGASSAPSPTAPPIPTPPPTPSPTSSPGNTVSVLVGAGDIAACGRDGDDATAALLDSVAGTVVTFGDNAYEEGTLQQYLDCYDTSWGRHRARTRPVPGNHEWLTPNAQGFREYFSWGSAPTYYAYDAGSWRVYAIDSSCSKVGGCGPGSPQWAWLAADLTAHPRACVLAYWHHPAFTIGPHADNEGGSAVLWNLLHDHGAEVILTGHDHNYQRWTPMLPDGTPNANGIRQFVNGAGGKNHTTPDRSDVRVQARNHDTFGVLKLTLRQSGYDWQFIPEAGKSFTDSGSGTCH